MNREKLMAFYFINLNIKDLILIKPKVYEDDRGHFLELYKRSDFYNAGISVNFNQDNQSQSKLGVIRGLHFQLGDNPQDKLVRCVRGAIYDVAVDLRPNSPTYKQWEAVRLTSNERNMLFIPKGFAHGFCALSGDSIVSYKCSGEYEPKNDAGVRFDDPDIGIKWPIDPKVALVSEKDRNLPFLKDIFPSFPI